MLLVGTEKRGIRMPPMGTVKKEEWLITDGECIEERKQVSE